MSYLGRSAKLSLKAQEKVSFLATAGQTSKTGLSYTPSFIEVYVNGVLLTDTTDFTATNGNSVTFTVALLLNDEVTVISLKTFTVADHYSKTEADTLLAAKSPLASPSFTGTVSADGLVVKSGGTTVGSIGNVSADLIIDNSTASGGAGLALQNNSRVNPRLNQAFSDGTVDLGYSNSRWKDLYLSGGVYLGGTGAANKLDDYEEGTWTPAFAGYTGTQPTIGSTQYHGTYTKIGNLVTLSAFLHAGSISGNTAEILVITGLPFDMATTGHVSGSHTSQNLNFVRPPVGSGLTGVVGGKLAFLTAVNNAAHGWEKVSILGTSGYIDCDVRMTVTYRTT